MSAAMSSTTMLGRARACWQHRPRPSAASGRWLTAPCHYHHTHAGRPHTALAAQVLPGPTPDVQIYVVNGEQRDVPVTAIQRLDPGAQAAVFGGIFAALGLTTYAVCTLTDLSWAHSSAQPLALGIPFLLAGFAHFAAHDSFCSMMPTKGAWGIWYLPGSDSFHVNWTGVAEIAAGLGLLSKTIPAIYDTAPWLYHASALGLFALTIAVTPSNIFMATHNAPGPGPKGATIPVAGHIARFFLQVFLLSSLWDAAVN